MKRHTTPGVTDGTTPTWPLCNLQRGRLNSGEVPGRMFYLLVRAEFGRGIKAAAPGGNRVPLLPPGFVATANRK